MPDTIRPDVASYLADALDQLSDLSGDAYEEMADAIESAIHEVAAETDLELEQVLGAPAEFVTELRIAAGQYAVDLKSRSARWWTPTHDRYVVLRDRVGGHPWAAWVRDLLMELRPAWWVARAWLALFAVQVMLDTGGGLDWALGIPLPSVAPAFISLFLVAAAVVGSVRLGRTPPQIGWRRWGLIGLNLVAVIGLLGVLGLVRNTEQFYEAGVVEEVYPTTIVAEPWHSEWSVALFGEPVTGVQTPAGSLFPVATTEELLAVAGALFDAYPGALLTVHTESAYYVFETLRDLEAALGGESFTVPDDPTAPFQE